MKIFNKSKTWLASAIFPICGLLSQNAAAVEAPVLADAYINSALPGNNFGNTTGLNIGGASSTFITFDMSTLPAGTIGSKVAKATLLLWVNKIGVAGAVDVLPVTAAWTETGITFGAPPNVGGSAVANVPVTAAAQYVAIDVSDLVKTWIDFPGQNFGLAIAASAGQPGTVASFDSKENTLTGRAPRLDITLVSDSIPGATGETGPTGPAGPQGIPGDKGDKGDKGDTGAAGAVGATGPDGAVGPAGPAGTAGAKGDKGDKGDTGTAGAVGATGPAGAVGPAGATGAQGLTGPAGVKGDKGDTGTAGAVGAAGPIGAVGPAGATGAQGPAGVKGDKGDTGTAGAVGATGPIGAVGPAGATGAQGLTGPAGSAGVKGDKGDTGAAGAVGATGPAGAVGPAGATGAQGLTGPAGPAGVKGDTGAVGATGPRGPSGSDGLQGPQGPQGIQGIQGIQGPAGPTIAGVIVEVSAVCSGTTCLVQCPATAQTYLSGTCNVSAGTADFPLQGTSVLRRTTDGDIFACTYVRPGPSGDRQAIATASCVARSVLHK